MAAKTLKILQILFFSYGLVFGQVTNSAQSTHRDSIRTYYIHINKAEAAIIDSNYEMALGHYKEAQKFKWPNGYDLLNAEIVAFLSKDTTAAMDYLNLLAMYGLKKRFVEGSRWGLTIADSPFYKYISQSYDSIYELSRNSDRAKYGKKMSPFFIKDQSARTSQLPGELSDASKKSDLANRKEMADFITANGFPSFDRTGFHDTMRRLDAPGTFWYLWWHSRPDTTLLDDIALNAVLDGDFPPEDYAILIDQRPQNNTGGSLYHSTPNLYTLTEDELSEVDKRRNEIYLQPLKEYEKKLEYRSKDKRFYLVNPMSYGLYHLGIEFRKIEEERRENKK